MQWPLWRVAVAERSMEPVLRPGDWLLVWRAPRAAGQSLRVRPGQLVVARHPAQPGMLLVKLLVWRGSRAGRPVRVRPGQMVIARHPGRPDLLLVKRAAWREAGGWWLESDNPGAGAVDSREFGAVDAALIEGRVITRYWPMRGR